MDNKIDIIHTPCKSCIFAIYDNKTQTGCELNKIEKYRAIGLQILDVYDDDKEFFVINKKKCLYFRDQSWYNKKELSSQKDAKNLVNEENELKYISVIYLETQTSFDDFKKIVESLMSQSIKPKGIMIIKEKKLKYLVSIGQISKLLTSINIPWRLQNFIDDGMTFNDKIKAIVKSAPIDRFYFLIYPSKYIECNFIEKISNYIQNGNSFGCINIHSNLFFSYLTLNYIKNLTNKDLLTDIETHTQYETIN